MQHSCATKTRLSGPEATHRPRNKPGCSAATLQRREGFGAAGEGLMWGDQDRRRVPVPTPRCSSCQRRGCPASLMPADRSRLVPARPGPAPPEPEVLGKMPLRGEKDSGYSSGVDRGSCKGPPRGGPKEGRARRALANLPLEARGSQPITDRNFSWEALGSFWLGKHLCPPEMGISLLKSWPGFLWWGDQC